MIFCRHVRTVNKACGSDGICSEHLKYASNVLVPLLAMSFTSFTSHGFLPESMLSGKISSKDNYRPIALASVISKLVEVINYVRPYGNVYDYKS